MKLARSLALPEVPAVEQERLLRLQEPHDLAMILDRLAGASHRRKIDAELARHQPGDLLGPLGSNDDPIAAVAKRLDPPSFSLTRFRPHGRAGRLQVLRVTHGFPPAKFSVPVSLHLAATAAGALLLR
jgi:hypothetical protein